MSSVARPATALWRDALAHVGGLLEQTESERIAALAVLAQTRPDLHSVVTSLLCAQREAEAAGFLEPGAESASEALSAGSTVGAWRIESQIGSGGMGEVWLARRSDGMFEGEVAIKTLYPWFARGALRERFLREAQLLGRISHPNIARLIDAGVSDDGAMYLVLEYVRGVALDQYCDEQQLDTAARLRLFLSVCVAVAHAHSHLIVHRDLKPSNILVTAAAEVKLLDFGVATLLEAEAASASNLTRLTGRAFTPEYAAPEQLRGEPVSTATDVYSLGVILYGLLTGQRPHAPNSADSAALEHAVLHDEAPLPSRALRAGSAPEVAQQRSTTLARLRREVAGDLDNIVARALEKRPADRYESVTALAADIERHLRHQPVQARAASLRYRAGKFLRRNRLPVAVGGAALVAVIAGALVAFSQASLARVEARKANAIRDFLVGVFERSSVAHPDGAKARKTTAEELLAQSVQEIRTGLADSPEVRRELLGVMSRLYASLDMQANAIELLNERLAADRALFGPRSLQVAKTLNDLAYSQVQIGDYEKAIASANESLALFAALDDENSLEHAKAYSNLAQASYRLGKGGEVVRVNFAAALALIEKHHPHDKARIEAMIGMARAANYDSKNDLYLQYCEQALGLLDQGVVVADGIVRGSVLQCVGNALTWVNRADEAEAKILAAIAEYDRAGGPDHPFAAAGRLELGTTYMWTERRAEAKRLLAEALASLERVKGPDDPEITAHARSDYASTLYLRGELAEAEMQMLRAQRSVQGQTGMIVPRMDMNLGRLQTQQGRFAEANKHLRDIEPRVVGLFGQGSWMHGTAMLRAGDLALAEGRTADAQVCYGRLWSEYEKAPDSFNSNHAAAGVGLVRIQLASGDAGAARELAARLLATIEGSKSRRDMPDEEAGASMLLGVTLLANGDAAGARPRLEHAVAMRERMDAPQSLWLAEARLHLARALHMSGDKAAARRQLALAEEAHRLQGRVGPQYASLLTASRGYLADHSR
jgi:serine/threonine-protein kinase